jgi:hypothetical protein
MNELEKALEAMGPKPSKCHSHEEWLLIAFERSAFAVAERNSHLQQPDPVEHYGVLAQEIIRRMKPREAPAK